MSVIFNNLFNVYQKTFLLSAHQHIRPLQAAHRTELNRATRYASAGHSVRTDKHKQATIQQFIRLATFEQATRLKATSAPDYKRLVLLTDGWN